MNRTVRIEPEAEEDLQAAAEWYEAQQAGLGFSLLRRVGRVYERIATGEHGTPVPLARSDARRVAVPQFPLWVVFVETRDEAVVVVHAHERRRPGYWKGRR